MTRARRRFTLVELLLVVFILAAVAATATSLTAQVDEQFRYDDTKARREEIRRAILGDPSRTANGQPIVSGFAADMGRLPTTLRELVESPGPAWMWNEVAQQGAGWRGPYLRADLERRADGTERRVYRDGWRNVGIDPESPDFGWLPGSSTTALFELRSAGADGVQDLTPNSGYPADFPATATLVEELDWRLDITGLIVRVRLPSGSAGDYRLIVRSPSNGVVSDSPFAPGEWPLADPDATANVSRVGTDASGDGLFEFPALAAPPAPYQPRWIPGGVRSLQLISNATGAPAVGIDARSVLLLPRASLPDLSQTPYLTP